MHDLRERWNRLWLALGGASSPDVPFTQLAAMYNQPGRAYHNLHHITACLDELDRCEYLAERPREMELALWYHDAIYDTHSTTNEADSAELALSAIRSGAMTHIASAAVKDLILATRHDHTPASTDGRLIADIDLAIFGQKSSTFDAYEEAIRKEYAWVDDAIFRIERSKAMRHFLDQPHIYHTAMFRGRFESTARSNLERSLQRWQAH